MLWLPLVFSETYTEVYAGRLYERLACKLNQRGRRDDPNILSNANLVLLYVDKEDGTESVLFDCFGIEALIVPLKLPDIVRLPLVTGNQRRRAVNLLNQEGLHAIRHARKLLSVIVEEITNRDNRTCLLLPQKNFGHHINKVLDCVRNAEIVGPNDDRFKADIGYVSRNIPSSSEVKGSYFIGRGGMIFRSPGKAYGRHALAPGWGTTGHHSSCVIRGRMRFGASYNPKFHYDCAITKEAGRRFPSCHGEETVRRGRTHANIAPNDNIR